MSVVMETTETDARGRRIFRCTSCAWSSVVLGEASAHARRCTRIARWRGYRADRVWLDEPDGTVVMGGEEDLAHPDQWEPEVRTRKRSEGALR